MKTVGKLAIIGAFLLAIIGAVFVLCKVGFCFTYVTK